jgi:hypothetical protein
MKLVKILSDKVQIRSNYKEFDDIRINDLISVSDDDVELVTMVSSLTDTDADEGGEIEENDYILEHSSVKKLECLIIGMVKNGTFKKVVDRYPTMKIKAHKITTDEFADMLKKYKEGFKIGKYASYDFPAYVDGNKFFQRHACIVGNTGAGKSETVAKILEQTSKLPGANVIVFDIHGEYKDLSYARNISIGSKTPFPIWMFGFEDMISNILKIKGETSTVAMTALRKCYYKVCPNGRENRPVYFDYIEFTKCMKYLDEQMIDTGNYYTTGARKGEPKVTKGDYNGKLTNVVNLLIDKAQDSKYQFLFDNVGQQYLYDFIGDVLNNDMPVKNIDLSEIPHDVAIPIIGAVTKLVYEIQRAHKTRDIHPVTIVCDEAHVYIPNDIQLSASQRRMVEIFEDIAKEGRKFGTTLLVASQRPSGLNKTIMAQCANFIVGKMNNENDKSMIKGMMPDGSENVIDETAMFSPGDVFVIGDSVPIPLKIHVDLAEERPQSRTIAFWDVWKTSGIIDVSGAAQKYING